MDSSDLRAKARSAYERGRLREALPWALPALPLAAVGAWVGGPVAWALGGVLAALVIALRWRGGDLGRGVLPGLVAGGFAAVPPLWWACGVTCGGALCTASCEAIAVAAGAAGGLLLWRWVGPRSAVSAIAVAACASAVGCVALGVGGLVGAGTLVVASAPSLMWRPARA